MENPLRALGQRFIRNRPRPTEYFVARIVAWSAVMMAMATGIGLMIAAIRLA